MSRQLRRVPLGFNWPINQTWEGFLNNVPYTATKCETCDGDCMSPRARELHHLWYGNSEPYYDPAADGKEPITSAHPAARALAERRCRNDAWYYGSGPANVEREAKRLAAHWNKGWAHFLNDADVAALVEGGRLMEFTHTWDDEARRWIKNDPATIPTAADVNAWSLGGMGHDGINEGVVLRARLKAEGDAGYCETCEGAGVFWTSPEARERYENWEPTEPPTGEGYQLWQTVSEGSPITPVFSNAEQLARYLAASEYSDGLDMVGWMRFIEGPGWCPSGAFIDGQALTGPELAVAFG